MASDETAGTELELSCDPSDYSLKKLSAEIIHFLLSKKNDMALNEQHKRAVWYYRDYPDGSKNIRSWLVYSKKTKCLFCLPCLIFGSPNVPGTTVTSFAVKGYSDWVNVSRDVKLHDKSSYHRDSELALIRWNTGNQRIDKQSIETHNYWVQHNRAVLSVVIDCVRYLTAEMLAFRKAQAGEGKLIGLFRAFAKYSPDACAYLERLQKARQEKKRLRVNFLAYDSVLNLVSIMKDMVLKIICEGIAAAGGMYSIIADSTQDSSKMESTVIIARYIEGLVDREDLSIMPHPIPVERLLGVFTSKETTGLELYNQTIAILKGYDLKLTNIVGQSYDGAANMRGDAKGMKTRVQQICPAALYIWCHAHRFAKVVENSVENCIQMKTFLGLLEEMHTFMNGHRRHGVFVEVLQRSKIDNQKTQNFDKIRLKRVATTRWSSLRESAKTVDLCFQELLDCFRIIAADKNMPRESITSATGFSVKMLDFDFVACLKIGVTIFDLLLPATTMLQGRVLDIGAAISIIAHTIQKLKKLRTDESWAKIEEKIRSVCSEYNIKYEKRARRKTRFFDEYGLDYHEPDYLSSLKQNVFYFMIDNLLEEMEDRFNKQNLDIMNDMQIFSHENLMKANYPTRADNLCRNYNLDPDSVEAELKEFKEIYTAMESNIDLSDLYEEEKKGKKNSKDHEENSEYEDVEEDEFDTRGMADFIRKGFMKPFRLLFQLSSSNFSHLFVLYKILITLAVTSCSAEVAFSKEKIIKNYLRSSMLDPWLSAMMILCAEKDVLDRISNEDIINKLAKKSKPYQMLLKK